MERNETLAKVAKTAGKLFLLNAAGLGPAYFTWKLVSSIAEGNFSSAVMLLTLGELGQELAEPSATTTELTEC